MASTDAAPQGNPSTSTEVNTDVVVDAGSMAEAANETVGSESKPAPKTAAKAFASATYISLAVTAVVLTAMVVAIAVMDSGEHATVDLRSIKTWEKEEGFWVGEYTLLGPDGNPFTDLKRPYKFDHYKGFINITLVGSNFIQNNIFVYPPEDAAFCSQPFTADQLAAHSDDLGDGACGTNGGVRIYNAFGYGVDRKGTTRAPRCTASIFDPNWRTSPDCHPLYVEGASSTPRGDGKVTVLDDEALAYQLYADMSEIGGSSTAMIMNQFNTLPTLGSNKRYRTAHGINPMNGAVTYASFYREEKVDEAAFLAAIADAKADYNVHASKDGVVLRKYSAAIFEDYPSYEV